MKMKINKRKRVSELWRLFHFYNVQAYGIYHAYYTLVKNPEYADAWTPKERALMLKKLEELNELISFFSKMGRRLRHG